MDKGILKDYIDACESIKEAEADIRNLKKRRNTMVQGVVKGSMHEFPYAAQNFHIEGLPYSVVQESGRLEAEERLLEERKAQAEHVKVQVDAWMNTIPQRMQRIIRYKIFQKLSWDEVAVKMDERRTGDAYRKQLYDFLKEK